jgi:hypothetical protein
MFAPKVPKPQTKEATNSTNISVRRQPTLAVDRPGHGTAEQLLALQITIGNQATLRLLSKHGFSPTGKKAGGDRKQEADPACLTAQEAEPSLSWDFSKIPLFPPNRPSGYQPVSSLIPPSLPGTIQPKLAVGLVGQCRWGDADPVCFHFRHCGRAGV